MLKHMTSTIFRLAFLLPIFTIGVTGTADNVTDVGREQSNLINELNKDNMRKQQQIERLTELIQEQNETVRAQKMQQDTLAKELIQKQNEMIHTQNLYQENWEKKKAFLKVLFDEWTYYKEDGTFLKVFAKYWKIQVTYYQARKACQAFDGGDLVIIRDEEKNNFVYNIAKVSGAWEQMWIGIRNEKYVDGTDLGSYQPWIYRLPGGYGTGDIHCVRLYIGNYKYARKWWDYRCDNTKSYMCEVNILN